MDFSFPDGSFRPLTGHAKVFAGGVPKFGKPGFL
jgi:hypothetical protein